MMVALDGFILDIQGPYFSDSCNNDAAILMKEFETNKKMREWFKENDILLVDSAYRDSQTALKDLGLSCKMTKPLLRGQCQLCTEDANASRLVTKLRWIVEARNGHLKSIFKFLQNPMQLQHMVNINDFYQIAAALINKYYSLVHIEGANYKLARKMIEKSKEANIVRALVEVEKLHTRNAHRWLKLDEADLHDFPILSLEFLENLTFGTYQLKLSPSYIQDKLLRENDELFEIEMLRDKNFVPEPGFIRVRVFSRFRKAGKYQLWVVYLSTEEEEEEKEAVSLMEEENPILGYYCTCKSGARTVGTSAHVVSVLWYLGYARHETDIQYPSMKLFEKVKDAGNRSSNDL